MATRNIVPRATGEGGIGTAAKKWALGWINALTVSTINALTLTAQTIGCTIEGGTTSKTFTVDETAALSSKAPKANPVFTGDVKGASGDQIFAGVNATNSGIFAVGAGLNKGSFSLLDNQSMTISLGSFGALVKIDNVSTGRTALFFINYIGTILVLSDNGSEWVITDVDSGKLAIFKSSSSAVISIKNYANATRILNINVLGCSVSTSTLPA